MCCTTDTALYLNQGSGIDMKTSKKKKQQLVSKIPKTTTAPAWVAALYHRQSRLLDLRVCVCVCKRPYDSFGKWSGWLR